MVYRVALTDRAVRDLASIFQRIEAETGGRAAKWFGGIERAINSLEKNPRRAPITPEDRGLQHLLYGKKPNVYGIIFGIAESAATIFVLHIRAPRRDKMPRRSRSSRIT